MPLLGDVGIESAVAAAAVVEELGIGAVAIEREEEDDDEGGEVLVIASMGW